MAVGHARQQDNDACWLYKCNGPGHGRQYRHTQRIAQLTCGVGRHGRQVGVLYRHARGQRMWATKISSPGRCPATAPRRTVRPIAGAADRCLHARISAHRDHLFRDRDQRGLRRTHELRTTVPRGYGLPTSFGARARTRGRTRWPCTPAGEGLGAVPARAARGRAAAHPVRQG